MSKYTPGPWTVNEYGTIKTPSGETLLVHGVALPSGVHPQQKEAECNTLLIAVAPEMLEALNKTVPLLQAAQRKELLGEVLAVIKKAECR